MEGVGIAFEFLRYSIVVLYLIFLGGGVESARAFEVFLIVGQCTSARAFELFLMVSQSV